METEETPATTDTSTSEETTQKAKKTRKLRKNRSRLQSTTPPTTLVGTVRYHLVPVASNVASEQMKEDKKMFYAKVVPWRRQNLASLIKRMKDEGLPVTMQTAEMVIKTLMETIVRCLKEGDQVTIDKFFTLGISLPGRVGIPISRKRKAALKEAREAGEVFPDNALYVDQSAVRGVLSARPWVRFAPAMLDEINNDLQITHIGVTQPVPDGVPSLPKARRNRKPKTETPSPSDAEEGAATE